MRLTGDILEAIKSRSYQLRPVAQGPARYFLSTALGCTAVMYRRTSAPEPGLGLGQILARRLALGYPGMEEEPPSMIRQIQMLLAGSRLLCSEGLLCNLNGLLSHRC